MSEFKIEKGIPLPLPSRRGRRKYPWALRNQPSWTFTAITLTEDGVKGVRVWRIK